MKRQKLPQELFMQRLNVLTPNAKCDVRPYNNNESLVDHPVVRGDMLINWHPENGECPTLEAINAVTDAQVNVMEEANRKVSRNKQYEKDLSMKALFKLERKDNPALTFSDFLDGLEVE